MPDNNSIIGEDPGVIIKKAFAHLQQSLCINQPIDLIALQFQSQQEGSKLKEKKIYI